MMSLPILLSIVMIGIIFGAGIYFFYEVFESWTFGKAKAYAQTLVDLCDRMFMQLSLRSALTLVIVTTGTCTLLGFYLTFGLGWVNLFFTFFLGTLGFLLPKIFLTLLLERRLEAFNEQLIDALTLLSNSIKSGLNLSQAIHVLVREMPNPISQEFAVVLSQEKIGLTIDDALEKLSQRIPSEDLGVMIQSVLILRETGGNLSETFEVIAETIRERRRVDGKIKSMTAQGKVQGLILFILPFAFLLVLYTINPPYVMPLFTTQLGWILIAVMLMFQILGGLWIRKVVKIEV